MECKENQPALQQQHCEDMAEYSKDSELPITISCPVEAKKEVRCNSQPPFTILNKYGSHQKRPRNGEPSQLNHLEVETTKGTSSETGGKISTSQVLSSVSILRMAKMEFSQFKSQKTGNISTLAKAFGFDSHLTCKIAKHLKRVLLLLDAAEKYSNRQYDLAEELLIPVPLSSHADNPIERVITYFARDLRERIDVTKSKIDLEKEVTHVDVEQALIDLKAAIHACEQQLLIVQIAHFTAIQTILESVASAERIHFVDIGKKLGSYLIVMMHALASRKTCKLEQLKITVVCTTKDNVEETGKLLSSFAESMNLPFAFKILYSEMYEFKKDQFELEAGEMLAVYLEYGLISLSDCPKNIEANTSGSTFIDRFHEALFLCSATFDCLEYCLEHDNQFREIVEKVYFQEIIINGVMCNTPTKIELV